jgi:GNAT superfamily N-acetyltransferase
MPLRPDPDRPGWLTLTDAHGAEVGTFLRGERDGRPLADLFERDTTPEDAVPAILAELRGWRIAADEALGEALIAAGARPVRHAHVYTHHLQSVPGPGEGEPLGAHTVDDLVPAFAAAFGPDHPDGVRDPRSALAHATGDELLDASGVIVRDGRVVAGIIIGRFEGEPPFGGPWVMELFRDPAHPGTGRALLERALHRAAEAGLPALGLAVTEGNPATRLYEAVGFRRVLTAVSVDL